MHASIVSTSPIVRLSAITRECRPPAPSAFLGRLILLAAFLLCASFTALPAVAGRYDRVYSGGGWITTSTSGSDSGPYAEGDSSYGAATIYYGDDVLADCNGEISVTFTWVPAYDGDDPPASCIMEESCSASATWVYSYMDDYTGSPPLGSAAADCDMPNGQSDSYVTSTWATTTSSGSKFWVKSNPGLSFTVTVDPAANASAVGTAAWSSVAYAAIAVPPIVQLEGVINSNSSLNILIGQGIRASLDTGQFHQTTWSWTISGDPFDGFQLGPNSQTGHAIEMTPQERALATVSYFYRSIRDKGAAPPAGQSSSQKTVTCIATVTDPNQPNAPPLTVTGRATVNVWQPGHNFTYTHEGLGFFQHVVNGPYYLEGNGSSGRTITWHGDVTTPSIFIGEDRTGTWNFTQIIKPNDYYVKNGVEHDDPNFGKTGLDSQFPYQNQSYDADGVSRTSGDRPSIQVDNSWSQISVNFFAWTWMSYMPPNAGANLGTTWVPLHEITWSVAGTANFDGTMWTVAMLGDGVTVADLGPVSVLPDWMQILTASDTSTW